MIGIVMASSCGVFSILAKGEIFDCKPRGLFRHYSEKPLVGDKVEFDEAEKTIKKILPRRNHLIRPSIANVDELVIVMSTVEPKFSSFLVNKFLSYANYFNIPASVIITKTDMIKLDDYLVYQEDLNKLGVSVYYFSSITLAGLDQIKTSFNGKTVALMGQTGVGKSSLLNCLIPDTNRKIGEYSVALGRGKHMTKEVILIPNNEGFIADTPGFSSLELPFFKEDLAKVFPGFEELSNKCKFADCLHVNERECKIKEAVEHNMIAVDTYADYIRLLEDVKFKKDRY